MANNDRYDELPRLWQIIPSLEQLQLNQADLSAFNAVTGK